MMIQNRMRVMWVMMSLLAASCTPDNKDGAIDSAQTLKGERVAVSVNVVGEGVLSSKSSLLEGSEDKFSGAEVFIYYADNGLLDSVQEIPASAFAPSSGGSGAVLSFPSKRKVRVYVSGNLWAVSKSDGSICGLGRALGADFPMKESEFLDMEYRLDGSAVNGKYRFEKMSEVASYGIPFSGSVREMEYKDNSSISVQCVRLFAKIHLTIDHGNLDGGGANPEFFKNGHLYLRQTNCRVLPFSDRESLALKAEDVIEGDYDPSMVNGTSLTFDFYVPENCQGTLLPGNTKQSMKTREHLESVFGIERAGLLTYVEFCGEVNPDAGGYGGPVTYRFYLGEDNCTNFDVVRGRRYDVTLSFNVNSLFDPYWKVSPELTDGRNVGISADSGFSSPLPFGQMVAVRCNRPGRMYLYVEAGAGGVRRIPDGIVDDGYKPVSLSDCPVSTNFLSSDGRVVSSELSDLGITPLFDETSGLLSFTVTDVSKFKSGRNISLHVTIQPKGKTYSFELSTYDDIGVSWDKSLTDGFYPGMKRTATLSGFVGTVGVTCSDSHMFKHKNTAGVGNLVTGDPASSPRLTNGKFDIFNYYYCNNADYVFTFTPEDSFNDGYPVKSPVKNAMPDIRIKGLVSDLPESQVPIGWSDKNAMYLDITGAPWLLPLSIELYAPGSSRKLEYSEFDAVAFSHVYSPKLIADDNVSNLEIDGETIYSGSEDSYIGITKRQTGTGFPEFDIFRRRIGDYFDTYESENVRLRNCRIMLMPTVSQYYGKGFFRVNKYLNIYLRPFMISGTKVDFAKRYDDYTLWKSEYLDEPFRSLVESSANGNGAEGSIGFNVQDASMMKLCAVPTRSSSYSGGEASESLIVSSEKKPGLPGIIGEFSFVNMKFVDNGSNKHSAGPHEIRAYVTNRHSLESKYVKIGETDVFVHFVVGVDYDHVASYFDGVSGGYLGIVPRIMSDISRTSFGDAGYNSELSKSVEMYSSDASVDGMLHLENKFTGVPYNYTIRSTNGTGWAKSYAYHYAVSTSLSIRQYKIEPVNSTQEAIFELQNYYSSCLMSDGGVNEKIALLARTMGPNVLKMSFYNTKNGPADSQVSLDVFDYTGFGNLRYYDGDRERGYYVFHLLSDLNMESRGWIPYFEWLSK